MTLIRNAQAGVPLLAPKVAEGLALVVELDLLRYVAMLALSSDSSRFRSKSFEHDDVGILHRLLLTNLLEPRFLLYSQHPVYSQLVGRIGSD